VHEGSKSSCFCKAVHPTFLVDFIDGIIAMKDMGRCPVVTAMALAPSYDHSWPSLFFSTFSFAVLTVATVSSSAD